ncbi:hypothetical protein DEFDS_1207 [Deferribacter desulfuricans SSM1]|uniref:Uncharacterized protein n=1 Tax=Deferribacter desulfuricans (strain DSM 14783 / JCM 11476 / NBRC 101012 / SSM1) TaxID=639282 RepID=D3PDK2_DEFDS|nr:hypothetical protein [Deferribacter desulfuricans]BAI80675.1 hypothetical protein DEFDS_1207 [Deferribacter desulfuricans SSM1]
MIENYEDLIRKIYHDSVNLLNPIKEIIKLQYGKDDIMMELVPSMAYVIDILTNSRALVILESQKFEFKKEEFLLYEVLTEILQIIKDNYISKSDFINLKNFEEMYEVSLNTNKYLFHLLLYNLILNAYRFGYNTAVYYYCGKIIIKNNIKIKFDSNSIFELPIATDRFGITGSGFGLKIVKKILNELDISLEDNIYEDEVEVSINIKNILIG